MATLFSIIIPVLNNWELTKNCLHSIAENTNHLAFELIVVDNGSTDSTRDELEPLGKQLFSNNFKRLRFEENRNFGPACNAGAALANSPYLFFLNNDTVALPGWAEPLLEHLDKEPKVGAVGSFLLFEDDTVQHAGVVFSDNGVFHLYAYFSQKNPVTRKNRRVQALTGAALMVRAELFKDIQGFYEGFINGFEDVDLCLRIRQKGYLLELVAASSLYHFESKTPGRSANETANSRLLLERCSDLYFIDLHHHAYRDGFDLCFDAFGSMQFILKEKDEEKLNARLSHMELNEILPLCIENPFWRGGFSYFAEICAKNELYDISQECLRALYGIKPDKDVFVRMLKNVYFIRELKLKEKYLQDLMQIQKKMEAADPEAHLRKTLRKASKDKDMPLCRLIQDELDKKYNC